MLILVEFPNKNFHLKNFVKGNPNGPKTPVNWPTYGLSDTKTIHFKNPITVDTNSRDNKIKFFQKYYPNGIEVSEELDIIEEPFVSFVLNNHGRRLLLALMKANMLVISSIIVGVFTIISIVIYCCCFTTSRVPKSKKE